MPIDGNTFTLWGRPDADDDGEPPLRLREATVVADISLLRKMAEFFTYAADQLAEHGTDFGHAHFCDYANVPAAQQRGADIIVGNPDT